MYTFRLLRSAAQPFLISSTGEEVTRSFRAGQNVVKVIKHTPRKLFLASSKVCVVKSEIYNKNFHTALFLAIPY